MNVHYNVSGLRTVVWRSHPGQIVSGLSELARVEGGSVLIAHMLHIQESASSRQLGR